MPTGGASSGRMLRTHSIGRYCFLAGAVKLQRCLPSWLSKALPLRSDSSLLLQRRTRKRVCGLGSVTE